MRNFVTKEHQRECIQAIKRCVRFPSVLNEQEINTPFGQAIQDVLEDTLQLAKELGFRTFLDPKGYYGYAETGQGEESLAILCHLDVVPPGDITQWKTPPFEAIEQDGMLYGRGVQDDKGPTMTALYAVKALMDSGVTLKKRIRFIFGTDEETLWRCMNRYSQIEEKATMGFAPDSAFPLTYAEKGLLQVKIHGEGTSDMELQIGEAFNVVPGKAMYTGAHLNQVKQKLVKYNIPFESDEESITVLGESVHAKDAPKGKNALLLLVKVLGEIYHHPVLAFLTNEAGTSGTGEKLFGVVEDEPSGNLTFNVAKLVMDAFGSEIGIDMRIPVLSDKEVLVAQLKSKLEKYHLTYEEYDYLPALYVPLDSFLVTTLMQVYQDKTEDFTPAQSSGGATYARVMENCVAFGAQLPHTKQTEHQENECVPIQDIYQAMSIYAEAVYRLAAV